MSFSIGLSGLSAASDEINIAGNNIANASTTGFKKSRAEFGSVYAASVLGGGGNQQGSGVSLQNIGQDFSQGSVSFTGNALDLAINGSGFFVLNGEAGTSYTRAGAFGSDKDGNIVNSQGERLQGFAPTANGGASGGGALTDLVVTTGEISPQQTSIVNSTINLDAAAPPSTIVGTKLSTNSGTSGEPKLGVRSARPAEISGRLSTAGTDFSGTIAASVSGSFDISAGLDFLTAGGNQRFSVSVNGNPYQSIDLSGADTGDQAALILHVQTQLDGALTPPNNLVVSAENNRLVLTSAATGDASNITIGNLVEGLAQNIVTSGSTQSGKTAPSSGFTLTLDGVSKEIVIDNDFTNAGPAALALGGRAGSGNQALENNIQSQINSSPALSGKIAANIDADGIITFTATDAGEKNIQIDPVLSTLGSVNFDQIVTFETNRRQGNLTLSSLDFSGANDTSFSITVGESTQQIVLTQNYSTTGIPSEDLGGFTESGLEALEDEIQRQINISNLPGSVRVSIGSAGDIAFEITGSVESSIEVSSDSETARTIGGVDVSNGFNFDAGNGGTEYSFTIAYSIDGNPTVTSNTITLNEEFISGSNLINSIQDAINTDANFSFSPGNEEILASIDPATGFLVIETSDAGPLAQIAIVVTDPNPLATPSLIQDTSAEPGGVIDGLGPAVDFNTFASFTGNELDNTGAESITNGYLGETIQISDASNDTRLISIPAGASANEVAQLFNGLTGVTATATTVAYIVATNRGDPENIAPSIAENVDANLPLRFAINGINFSTSESDPDLRLEDLASQINESSGSLSAAVVVDANGDNLLEVTENNGRDLAFGGGTNGLGSITVQGSERDAVTGENRVSPTVSDLRQLTNLANLTDDSIVVGGVVDFTLEEGVKLSDASETADGTPIAGTANSIFGGIPDDEPLTATGFELNTFNPKDPDTYYRSTGLSVFDSAGIPHTMTQYFVRERPEEGSAFQGSVWSVYVQIDGEDVGFDPNNPEEPAVAQATIRFDTNGRYDPRNEPFYITNWTPKSSAGLLTSSAAGPTPGDISAVGSATSSNFEVDLSDFSQFGGDFSVNSNTQDGYAKGQLVGLDIDTKGIIFARFSNGQSQILGEVALADFENPAGLSNLGGTRFAETPASGVGTPSGAGTAGLGVIQSGALEDSNVDLSDQLVKLIISQRNFQAAAQIIEAADSTTQTIINL